MGWVVIHDRKAIFEPEVRVTIPFIMKFGSDFVLKMVSFHRFGQDLLRYHSVY